MTVLASGLSPDYDTAIDAVVAHAPNITGVVSTIAHDFTSGELKQRVIIFSTRQEDGSFDTNTTFTADVEIGGYAVVDPTVVEQLVEYSIQHDIECVQ